MYNVQCTMYNVNYSFLIINCSLHITLGKQFLRDKYSLVFS